MHFKITKKKVSSEFQLLCSHYEQDMLWQYHYAKIYLLILAFYWFFEERPYFKVKFAQDLFPFRVILWFLPFLHFLFPLLWACTSARNIRTHAHRSQSQVQSYWIVFWNDDKQTDTEIRQLILLSPCNLRRIFKLNSLCSLCWHGPHFSRGLIRYSWLDSIFVILFDTRTLKKRLIKSEGLVDFSLSLSKRGHVERWTLDGSFTCKRVWNTLVYWALCPLRKTIICTEWK